MVRGSRSEEILANETQTSQLALILATIWLRVSEQALQKLKGFMQLLSESGNGAFTS